MIFSLPFFKKQYLRIGVLLVFFLVPLLIIPNTATGNLVPKVIFFIIFIDLLSLGLLWEKWQDGGIFSRSSLGAVLAFFVFIQIVAASFGASPWKSFFSDVSRMNGVVLLVHFVLFFLLVASVLERESNVKLFFGTSVLVSVVTVFIGISHFYITNVGQFISTFGNEGNFAQYVTLNVFLSLWLLSMETSRRWKNVWYSALFLQIVAIFMVANRGAYLGLGAGITIFLWHWKMPVWKAWMKKVVIAGVCFLMLCAGGIFLFRSEITDTMIGRKVTSKLSADTIQTRVIYWKTAFHAFREHPLLGWGPENFDLPYSKYYDPTIFRYSTYEPWANRVHNLPLEVLVGSGLIGLIAWLLLWWMIFRNAAKNRAMLAFVTAFFVISLFEVEDFSSNVLLFGVLGYLAVFAENSRWEIPHRITGWLTRPVVQSFGKWLLVCFLGTSMLYFSVYAYANTKMEHASYQLLPALQFTNFMETFEQGFRAAALNPPLQLSQTMLAIRNFENMTSGKELSGIPESFFIFLGTKMEDLLKQLPLETAQPYYVLGGFLESWASANPARLPLADYFLNKGLSVNTKQQVFYLELALLHFGNPEALHQDLGFQYLRLAIAQDENAGVGHWYLGRAYLQHGMKDLAGEELEKALKMNVPFADFDVSDEISDFLEEQRRYDALVLYYQKAVGLSSYVNNAHVHAKLANAYERVGNVEKATKERAKAHELDSSI